MGCAAPACHIPAPQHQPKGGVQQSHSTCGPARARRMVMGLFPCSSEILLDGFRALSFSTASKCQSMTRRWGLRLEQTRSQGQTPVRMGRGSVQGRIPKPTPKMLPAWKGPPRLWQGNPAGDWGVPTDPPGMPELAAGTQRGAADAEAAGGTGGCPPAGHTWAPAPAFHPPEPPPETGHQTQR